MMNKAKLRYSKFRVRNSGFKCTSAQCIRVNNEKAVLEYWHLSFEVKKTLRLCVSAAAER
jgi:hypothetical protein